MVRTVGMEKRGQAFGRCREEALLINSLWHMRMRVEIYPGFPQVSILGNTLRIEKKVPLKGAKKMMESILGHIEFEGTSL